MQTAAFVARVVLAVVFVVAGLAKLRRPAAAVDAVRRFHLVPDTWAPRIGRWLAPAELACGVLLAVGAPLRLAALFGGVLLLGFTVAITGTLLAGRPVSCGCFGSASVRPVTWWSVVRNAALLAAATVVLAAPPDGGGLAGPAAYGLAGGDALALVITCTALLLSLSVVAETTRSLRAAHPGGHR